MTRLHVWFITTQVANVVQAVTVDVRASIQAVYGIDILGRQWRMVQTGIHARGPLGLSGPGLSNGPAAYLLDFTDPSAADQYVTANSSYPRTTNRQLAVGWDGKVTFTPAGIVVRPAGPNPADETPVVWFDLVEVGTPSDPYGGAAPSASDLRRADADAGSEGYRVHPVDRKPVDLG